MRLRELLFKVAMLDVATERRKRRKKGQPRKKRFASVSIPNKIRKRFGMVER